MKNQKGITLIALVITIIVLLILAGVSIAMLTGDNGLLTRARETQTASDKAEAADRVNMELTALYADILAGEELTLGADQSINGVTVTIEDTDDSEESIVYKVTATMTVGTQDATGTIEYNSTDKKYEMTAATY